MSDRVINVLAILIICLGFFVGFKLPMDISLLALAAIVAVISTIFSSRDSGTMATALSMALIVIAVSMVVGQIVKIIFNPEVRAAIFRVLTT
jgi:hypothetical protein